MHERVSFNAELCAANDPAVAAVSAAAIYGKGVFTTIAVRRGDVFLWSKHWKRLMQNAERLGISTGLITEANLRNSLEELLKHNSVTDGKARITFFDESSHPAWHFRTTRGTSVLIQSAESFPFPGRYRLGISSYAINSGSPLAGVKSCNYLEPMLALDEARTAGFDEAVRSNERGEASSACMANLFWKESGSGRLFTPSLKSGCLPGTTREYVLERLEVAECNISLGDFLRRVEAVVLTSAVLGAMEASSLNGKELGNIVDEFTGLFP